jgi:hypothetical protein
MGYFRARKNVWAVGLALFSLYVQILIPMAQAIAATSGPKDGFSNRIWICTHYGFKLASSDTGEELPPAKGGNADCPTCLVYAIGLASLANTSEVTLPVPPNAEAENIVFTSTARFSFEVPSDYLTRAPPITA